MRAAVSGTGHRTGVDSTCSNVTAVGSGTGWGGAKTLRPNGRAVPARTASTSARTASTGL